MPHIRHVDRARRKQQNADADERRGTARERGYSRTWDKFARAWLETHPLCFYCANQGITAPGEVVDHIVPHAGPAESFWPDPGEDAETFFASCCNACHNGPKQSAERVAALQGKDVREILKRIGMLPVGFPGTDPDAPIPNAGAIIISGPPASGKTTEAKSINNDRFGQRKKLAIRYDLDDIAEAMGFPRYGRTPEQAQKAIVRRNNLLAKHPPKSPLILIVSAPTARERQYWIERTNGEMTILAASRKELINRVRADPERAAHLQHQIEAIDLWFARAA